QGSSQTAASADRATGNALIWNRRLLSTQTARCLLDFLRGLFYECWPERPALLSCLASPDVGMSPSSTSASFDFLCNSERRARDQILMQALAIQRPLSNHLVD